MMKLSTSVRVRVWSRDPRQNFYTIHCCIAAQKQVRGSRSELRCCDFNSMVKITFNYAQLTLTFSSSSFSSVIMTDNPNFCLVQNLLLSALLLSFYFVVDLRCTRKHICSWGPNIHKCKKGATQKMCPQKICPTQPKFHKCYDFRKHHHFFF